MLAGWNTPVFKIAQDDPDDSLPVGRHIRTEFLTVGLKIAFQCAEFRKIVYNSLTLVSEKTYVTVRVTMF
jgi:hypothetical protein